MRRIAALALLVDGVLQVVSQAPRWSSMADRSTRDQILVAAHVLAGFALAASAALVNAAGSDGGARSIRRLTWAAVTGTLVMALVETTWFDWTGTVVRALYSAAVLAVLKPTARSSR